MSLGIRPFDEPFNRVQPLLELGERRTEREPDKVMAGRVEELSPMAGVNVKEDAWDQNSL